MKVKTNTKLQRTVGQLVRASQTSQNKKSRQEIPKKGQSNEVKTNTKVQRTVGS